MKAKFRFRHIDPRGRLVFCGLEDLDKGYIDQTKFPSQKFGANLRGGYIRNKHGDLYVFTSEPDYVASSKRFKFFAESLATMTETFISSQNDYLEDIAQNTNRLIHNLTTLNAHNLQQLYDLVPQQNLTRNLNKNRKYVENLVKSNPQKAAQTLMNIAKNTTATKIEFSVYQKLFEKEPSLSQKQHNVHKVLTNINYIFFPDFTDKGMRVIIDCSSEDTVEAFFDYETVYVVLYHLLENAAKYSLLNTNLNIAIHPVEIGVSITFQMTSLKVEQSEREDIFHEGFSGSFPIKSGKAGRGVGLYLARRLLEMNNAQIEFWQDDKELSSSYGFPYHRTRFQFTLPNKKNRRSN